MLGRRIPGTRAWLLLALVAACSGTPDAAPGTTSATASTTKATTTTAPPAATTSTLASIPVAGVPTALVDIPGAVALSLATNGTDPPAVAWTVEGAVAVAALDLEAGSLGEPTVVNGDVEPVAHPIERPAVSVAHDGTTTIAFTSLDGANGSVHATTLGGEVVTISGPPRPETVLVHLTQGPDGAVASWLEDSTLSVARSDGAAWAEQEGVDDLTCDCCHPTPLTVGDSLAVAYRDLVRGDDGARRDVTVVVDAGGGFGDPVLVADDPWLLDACPLAGPAVTAVDGTLVVAWMDARQSLHPDQRTSTVWVDRMVEGAFGEDVAVTDGGAHGVPTIASDGTGRLHLVWETRSPVTGLSYASSADGGVSFSEPALLMAGAEGVVPRAPAAVVHGDSLVVSWADRSGGHVGVWRLADL